MGLKNNKEAIKAIYIGLLCTLSYLGCYFARNILGVVTPQMLEENILSIESIGGMSTGFMILYATGQLVNGRVGDILSCRYDENKGHVMVIVGKDEKCEISSTKVTYAVWMSFYNIYIATLQYVFRFPDAEWEFFVPWNAYMRLRHEMYCVM